MFEQPHRKAEVRWDWGKIVDEGGYQEQTWIIRLIERCFSLDMRRNLAPQVIKNVSSEKHENRSSLALYFVEVLLVFKIVHESPRPSGLETSEKNKQNAVLYLSTSKRQHQERSMQNTLISLKWCIIPHNSRLDKHINFPFPSSCFRSSLVSFSRCQPLPLCPSLPLALWSWPLLHS